MELWRDHVGDILTWQGAVAGTQFDWCKQYQSCPTLATPSFLCTMYYYVYVRTMQHTVAILFLNCVLIAIHSCFLYRVCTRAHTCIERFCAPLPPPPAPPAYTGAVRAKARQPPCSTHTLSARDLQDYGALLESKALSTTILWWA